MSTLNKGQVAVLAVVSVAGVGVSVYGGMRQAERTHAAGQHFVRFTTANQVQDLWIDPTKVQAIDVAVTGYTYKVRLTAQGYQFFVEGSVQDAETKINNALP